MTPHRIFSNLYLDEDVSVLIAELIRPHGFDVLTTREAHNLGQSDTFQPCLPPRSNGLFSPITDAISKLYTEVP